MSMLDGRHRRHVANQASAAERQWVVLSPNQTKEPFMAHSLAELTSVDAMKCAVDVIKVTMRARKVVEESEFLIEQSRSAIADSRSLLEQMAGPS